MLLFISRHNILPFFESLIAIHYIQKMPFLGLPFLVSGVFIMYLNFVISHFHFCRHSSVDCWLSARMEGWKNLCSHWWWDSRGQWGYGHLHALLGQHRGGRPVQDWWNNIWRSGEGFCWWCWSFAGGEFGGGNFFCRCFCHCFLFCGLFDFLFLSFRLVRRFSSSRHRGLKSVVSSCARWTGIPTSEVLPGTQLLRL